MFLPLLLIRDFGNVAWWIFAIPNVVGAAAMGWVLRSPEQSYELTRTHRLACDIFSAVTIAFHIFFVAAIVPIIVHQQALPIITLGVVSAIFLALIWQFRGIDRWLALAIWIVSLALFGSFTYFSDSSGDGPQGIMQPSRMDFVGLALVCVLGFATCPYLDLTFHRARQFSSGPRRSFGVGFGVVFASMIVFTYVYAHTAWTALPSLLIAILGTHLVLQASFTIAAHANEIRTRTYAWFVVAILAALPIVLTQLERRQHSPGDLDLWELAYRTFMGFYGLIFPAYVWLVMMPTKANPQKRWLIFYVAVAFAFPGYALGFLLRQYAWVTVGVAFVIVPRIFLITRKDRTLVQQNSAPM